MSIRSTLSRGLTFNRKVTINGHRFIVPRIYGMASSASEPWMVPLLAAIHESRPGRFIDVGVNVGQTLMKVRAVALVSD
mgnify:CR=1 FL=1